MARVLVVDDDPWIQRMASAVLAQRGHLVEVASDGWEALIHVGRVRPDLVITEMKLPTTDGWSFAAAVRDRDETRDVPFVFLATLRSDRNPGQGFRAEIDQILAKPFRLEQLEGTVDAALAKCPPAERALVVTAEHAAIGAADAAPTAAVATGNGGEPALVGSLDQFALSSILMVLELERKSGAVTLEGPESFGHITLRNGRVIQARVDGVGTQRGPLAVYELLTWSTGRFSFRAGEVSGEDEIGSSTSFLLLEGARFQDERNEAKGRN